MRTLTLPAPLRRFALPLLLAAWAPATFSQTFTACSSDGLAPPRALVERFISADCEACWADPSLRPTDPSALAIDWIVPSPRGDDAPLSAAALPEALERLRTLGRHVPAEGDTAVTDLPGYGSSAAGLHWRVAQGPALTNYLGVGVQLTTPRGRAANHPYTFTLLMLEALAAGEEGSHVARNLIRNVLQRPLVERKQLSKQEHPSVWEELAVMSIPESARADRLRLVGWVEDAQGRVVAAAQSACR